MIDPDPDELWHRLHADGDTGYVPPRTRQAAVLVLLYPDPAPCFPLIRRPESMPDHPGQIALPGGARKAEDRSLWDTALRETREELGVDQPVEPIASLHTVAVEVSNFCIAPWVGWTETRPAFQPDGREVAAVIEVSLAALLDPELRVEEEWTIRGRRCRVAFFSLQGHAVWGATARILLDLAERLGPRHPGPRPGSVLLL